VRWGGEEVLVRGREKVGEIAISLDRREGDYQIERQVNIWKRNKQSWF
jgi:hypothetical protein